ncbi:MAG TPA: transcriptional repressor LexA [Phycisphaerales bacterium]|nr:transcriptional repressor LexA [Phycisphaerales bacterium]HMP37724.1 transcriptional repressor LexA [Phycisphaerales bacterium]
MNLTPKQLRILQLIREWRVTRGYSPTMQELADALGVCKVTIFEHLDALQRKGAVRRDKNKARSLSIAEGLPIPDEATPLSFPLVGRIAAGVPIEKYEQNDQLRLEELFGPRLMRGAANGGHGNGSPTFALRVEGDSMRDEGILDGDYVLVERRETARNGERVVALIGEGETTLKRFYREPDGRIRLQPANDSFVPIIVDDCRIQGVVVGVLRRYA